MMPNNTVFPATGRIQTFVVPKTGDYMIEAAGAQGGIGGCPGGRGARVAGTFRLQRGEVLQIVVGQQGIGGGSPHQPAGGGGGGTFVWKGATALPLPEQPLIVAGGGGGGSDGGPGRAAEDGGDGAARGGCDGHGGGADPAAFSYSGGGGAGWRSSGDHGSTPTLCAGGTIFRGGSGANYCCNTGGTGGFGGGGGGAFLGCGSGGGGGYSGGSGGTQHGPGGGGGGSFNAGANRVAQSGVQAGHGEARISLVAAFPDSGPHPASILRAGATAVEATSVQRATASDANPAVRFVGCL